MNWADCFNTYEEACAFFGADSPASLRAEAEWEAAEEWIALQDDLEARGPRFGLLASGYARPNYDELPF